MEFTELELHPDLKKGIDEAGFTTCMPIQEQVFHFAFAGEDIYAQSQTGTGKTAAFLVSIFQRIMTDPSLHTRKALILAPTRELAVQIEEETRKLGKYLPISAGAFFGGVGYGPQIDMLKANVQIIIGTPGRIIDFLQQGKMLLNEVGFLVIDEADRMFDMGFIDDLRRLLRYLPTAEKRQTYLFSATLGERVRHLAWDYMRDPKEITIEPENVTVDLVTQEVHHVAASEKFRLLLGVLHKNKPQSALIFCNQKYMVEEVARRLNINGIACDFIMGDLPQNKRMEIIKRVKNGEVSILVATDVAARGLDIDSLDMVINYDVPLDTESYVHRIGRTARAGKSGKAVTLACEKFVYGLPAIEEFINMKIPVAPFDESLLEPDKSSGMHFSHSRDRNLSGPGRRGGREPRRDSRPDSRGGRRRPDLPSKPRTSQPDQSTRAHTSPAVMPPKPRIAPAVPRQDSPARNPSRRPTTVQEKDLYNMPLEERMRLYKKKYGGSSNAAPNSSEDSRQAPRGGQRRSTPQRATAQPSARRESPGRPRNTSSQRPHTAPSAAPRASSPASDKGSPIKRKGLLGLLSNIFKPGK